MDIAISLTQRNIDSICLTYGAPKQILADVKLGILAQTDQDYAKTKLTFASAKISSFIKEVSDASDINTSRDIAVQAKLAEIKDIPGPIVTEGVIAI